METVKEVKFRSNSQHTADWINGKLQFQFRDGSIIVFDPAQVHADNRARAERHGWEQRLNDSMALEMSKVMDKDERAATKRARLEALIAHYHSGVDAWNIARQGGGGGPKFDPGLVIQAIAQVREWTVDETNDKLAKLCEAKSVERDALLKTMSEEPKVAAAMAEIKAARKKPAVDPAGMLDELALF